MPRTPTFFCFPVHVGGVVRRPLHTHDNHELFLCTGGQGLQRTDAAVFPTRPGELYLFPAGQAHICDAVDAGGCAAFVLNVHDRAVPGDAAGLVELRTVLDRLCDMAFQDENRLPLSAGGQRCARRMFEEMAGESREQGPGHVAAQSVAFQSLLLLLMREPGLRGRLQADLPAADAAARMAGVLRYLDANCTEPVTVEQMAGLACLSRSHFHSVFKQATGYTLVEYVHHRRVRLAERLLRQTEMPIVRVAAACGYGNLSHFYHVFRGIMGRTPRQVRCGG